MTPKWEILILSLKGRGHFLNQLFGLLAPQLNGVPEVTIRQEWDNGPASEIGVKREALRRKSQAEYISWIDDDDFVAPDYVAKILPLLDGVDQISFNVKIFEDGRERMAYHSLAHGLWKDGTGTDLYRDISHVHPMRRELALQVPMEGGFGEDRRWADAMRAKVLSEHRVPEIMYYYLSRTRKDDAKDPFALQRLQLLGELTSRHTTPNPA